MTTWFIADPHFGHRNILEYEAEARPYASIEEHDEDLIEQWNAVVRTNDTVWCLGDFAFGRQALERVGARLQGRRRLVLGNHDRLPSRAYLDHGFAQLLGCAGHLSALLSHIPVDLGQAARFKVNLHGHLHSRPPPTPWHVNVGVEANRRRTGQPRPVTWEELATEIAAAADFARAARHPTGEHA